MLFGGKRLGSNLGHALRFNGTSDYIDCGDRPEFALTNFTIATWVKLDGPQPTKYIVGKYVSPTSVTPHSFGLGTQDGIPQVYGFVSGAGPGYVAVSGGLSLDDNRWHALALSYNSTRLSVYVDGHFVSSDMVADAGPFTNGLPLTIGALQNSQHFGGWIDDVRVYNRALSATDVGSLYATETVVGDVGRPAEPLKLQNASATFSQTVGDNFFATLMIDGITNDNLGWGVYPRNTDQAVAFETASDVGFADGTVLTFSLLSNVRSSPGTTGHTLGRFRLAVTTDLRSMFADGLQQGGDVTANWVTLDVLSAFSQSGAVLTPLGDGSLLVSGTLREDDIYTVTAATRLTGITGIKLEALTHPSLPHNGPGREPLNGNFHIAELTVTARPARGPRIDQQPLSLIKSSGQAAIFSVGATSDLPLSYQWFFNGVPVPGGTNSHLAITNLQTTNSGSYLVIVTDAGGSTLSQGATLRVDTTATPVLLQTATATYSQTIGDNFFAELMIDGVTNDHRGWGIYPEIRDQAAVFETTSDVGFAGGTRLNLSLLFNVRSGPGVTGHTLGRFRFAVTRDPRSTFADGLQSGGDVTANWVGLPILSAASQRGAVLTVLPDNSVLVSGTLNEEDLYTVSAITHLTGITGLRLEALAHNSLPHGGPGREPLNGNFHVSELSVMAEALGPLITEHPSSVVVSHGAAATFSVSALGPTPHSYQWHFNGTPIQNATNATLTVKDITPPNEGTYSVRVSNPHGTVNSSGAVLHVNTGALGGTVRFSKRIEGGSNAPVTDAYGNPLSGVGYLVQLYAGSSPLVLAPLSPIAPFDEAGQAGYFDDFTRVIPNSAPGDVVVFAVRAWEASAGPTYEKAIENRGAVGSSETFNLVLGGGTNAPAALTGLRPFALSGKPVITQQPLSISTVDQTNITLSVSVAGSAPISLQWFKDGVAINGASDATLTITNTAVSHSGLYSVIATNSFGTAASLAAEVRIRVLDRLAPAITITGPAAGLTTLDRVNLTGRIEDNVGITKAEWGRNRQVSGTLFLSNGVFSVQASLVRGTNVLFIRAFDAEGNSATAEVVPIQQAAREFFLAPVASVSEGGILTVPITIRSMGDVSAATLVLTYPRDYLADPQFQWAIERPGMLSSINTTQLNGLSASFALAGATVREGTNTLATIRFRVRSIPNNLTANLGLQVHSVSAVDGEPIMAGTDTRGATAALARRKYTGDNNANDLLDVGDASIMMRFLTGLDQIRSWDRSANDLNRNGQLDSGDVIRVLRAVVDLDPQPGSSTTQGLVLTRQSEAPELLSISADRARVKVGDKVKARVQATGRATLSGASFSLNFPADSLRLESAEAIRLGSIVPNGALNLWNLEPAQNDFTLQTGELHFGLSSASAWPTNNGEVVEFTFIVKDGALIKPRLPINIRQVQITDGWTLQSGADSEISISTSALANTTLAGVSRLADGSFQLRANAPTGTRHAVETSTDFQTWTPLGIVTAEDGTLSFTDSAASTQLHRFYRLKSVE